MRPAVTFPDAERAVGDFLGPLWAARGELFAPTVTNAAPSSLSGDSAVLQVALDGTPVVEYPAVERATVRFTFWTAGTKKSNAQRGASITQALVATHPGDAQVYSTRILTGPLKGVDADTGNSFVSFTARISLRPQAL